MRPWGEECLSAGGQGLSPLLWPQHQRQFLMGPGDVGAGGRRAVGRAVESGLGGAAGSGEGRGGGLMRTRAVWQPRRRRWRQSLSGRDSGLRDSRRPGRRHGNRGLRGARLRAARRPRRNICFARGCWEPGGAGGAAPPTPRKRNKLGQLSNEGPQMYLLMRGKGGSGAQFD